MAMEETIVKQCCAAFYGSDLARILLGDSFHPGGVRLTRHLGELLELDQRSQVLDVASGPGSSALCLAAGFQCKVTGVDLSEQNVTAATSEAVRAGLDHLASFELGDAESLPFSDATFDAIICECAFCTFPSKATAASEFHRVLKPGGRVGLSDLTRTEKPLPELDGLLAWVACIGDALPVSRYRSLLEEYGLSVRTVEEHNDALEEMVRAVQSRLLGLEIAAGLGKLDLPGMDLTAAKQFATAAVEAIHQGSLGYAVLTAQRDKEAAENATP